MSISTVGILKTENKPDFFECVTNITSALIKHYENTWHRPNVNVSMYPSDKPISRHFTVSFFDQGTPRNMLVSYDCDNDYNDNPELKGNKLIFSIGCWGNSIEIIESILKEFSEECFIIENDCDDNSIRKI